MLLTNNELFYKKALQIQNLDFTKDRFKHNNLYWNYRLSGIKLRLDYLSKNLKTTIDEKIIQEIDIRNCLKTILIYFNYQSQNIMDQKITIGCLVYYLKKQNTRKSCR